MRIFTIKAFIILLFLSLTTLNANEPPNAPEEEIEETNEIPLVVFSAFELDGAPLIVFGAESEIFSWLNVIGDIGIPTGYVANSPWASRYRLLAGYPLIQMDPWVLRGRSGSSVYGIASEFWSGTSVHLIQELYAGYQRERWQAGLTLGFEPHLSTYISFSDEYKEMNPSVKEGWYGTWIRGLYYAGIIGIVKPTERLSIFMKFAYTWPIEKSQSPFERTILDGRIGFGAGYKIW